MSGSTKKSTGRHTSSFHGTDFAFQVGELVLVKWTDGMVYFAKIKRIDHKRRKCTVVFDDKSQDEAHFSQIHSVDETTTDIICIKCKKDDSESPNEIVLCDTCGIGYHQKCHSPAIPSTALDLDTPWQCTYCDKGEKCPYLTESLDVLQNLLSDESEPEMEGVEKRNNITNKKSRRGTEGRHTKADPESSSSLAPPTVTRRRSPLSNADVVRHKLASISVTPSDRPTPSVHLRTADPECLNTPESTPESTPEPHTDRKRKKKHSHGHKKKYKRSTTDACTLSVTRLPMDTQEQAAVTAVKPPAEHQNGGLPDIGSTLERRPRSLRVSLSILDDSESGSVRVATPANSVKSSPQATPTIMSKDSDSNDDQMSDVFPIATASPPKQKLSVIQTSGAKEKPSSPVSEKAEMSIAFTASALPPSSIPDFASIEDMFEMSPTSAPPANSQRKPSTPLSSTTKKPPTSTVLEEKPTATTSLEKKPLPTTSLEKKPAPTTSLEKKPASTTSLEKKPPPTTSLEKKPASTTSLEKKPASTTSLEKKPASITPVEKKLTSTTTPMSIAKQAISQEDKTDMTMMIPVAGSSKMSVFKISVPAVSSPSVISRPNDGRDKIKSPVIQDPTGTKPLSHSSHTHSICRVMETQTLSTVIKPSSTNNSMQIQPSSTHTQPTSVITQNLTPQVPNSTSIITSSRSKPSTLTVKATEMTTTPHTPTQYTTVLTRHTSGTPVISVGTKRGWPEADVIITAVEKNIPPAKRRNIESPCEPIKPTRAESNNKESPGTVRPPLAGMTPQTSVVLSPSLYSPNIDSGNKPQYVYCVQSSPGRQPVYIPANILPHAHTHGKHSPKTTTPLYYTSDVASSTHVNTTKPYAIVNALPSSSGIGMFPARQITPIQQLSNGGGSIIVSPVPDKPKPVHTPPPPYEAPLQTDELNSSLQTINKKISAAFTNSSEDLLMSAFEDAWKKFQANGQKYDRPMAKDKVHVPPNAEVVTIPGQVPSRLSLVRPVGQRLRPVSHKVHRACSRCGRDATYLCSGCRAEWYCGRECQLKSWDTHNESCKR